MGSAYTPGLTVTRRTVIAKTRRLPIPGDVTVAAGDRVKAADTVARAALPGDIDTVRLDQILGLDACEVEKCLLVREGETVRAGQCLASLKAFFGLIHTKAKAPHAGEVEFFSRETGHMGIRRPSVPVEVTAYVDGVIAEVIPRQGVIVRCSGALVQGIFGVGGERHGQIGFCASSPDRQVTAEDLSGDLRDKVIVCGARVDAATLRRAAELGARAVVVGSIVDRDLIDFIGFDLGVAITGHEDLPLSLVVTEGFGKMAMAKRTFDLLKELEGCTASVNGATQIRAGAVRPEIIVPEDQHAAAPAIEEGAHAAELAVGTSIRVIRVPHFGLFGQVVELPPEPLTIETGATVRVLRARLADGRTVTLPRANVEIIRSA